MENNFDAQQHEDELPSVSWFLALSNPNLLSGDSDHKITEKNSKTLENINNNKRRPSSSSGALNRPVESKKEKRCSSAKAKFVATTAVGDSPKHGGKATARNGLIIQHENHNKYSSQEAEKCNASSLQPAQVSFSTGRVRDIYGDHNYAMPIYQTPSQPSFLCDMAVGNINNPNNDGINDGILVTGSFFSQEVPSPMGPSLLLNHQHQHLMDDEDMEEANLSLFDDDDYTNNKNYCSCWSFGAAEEEGNSNYYNSNNSEMMFFGNNNTAATMPLSY